LFYRLTKESVHPRLLCDAGILELLRGELIEEVSERGIAWLHFHAGQSLLLPVVGPCSRRIGAGGSRRPTIDWNIRKRRFFLK